MSKDNEKLEVTSDELILLKGMRWHCIEQNNHNNCEMQCVFNEILSLLGKKYSLAILRLLMTYEKLRFNQIQDFLKGSPKTITARLRLLETNNLIRREQFNEIPIRVEYSLTEAGRDLEKLFIELDNWLGSWKSLFNLSDSMKK